VNLKRRASIVIEEVSAARRTRGRNLIFLEVIRYVNAEFFFFFLAYMYKRR
jgi:hypothetical protein